MELIKRLSLILGLVWFLTPQDLPGQDPDPVVHAVFFFSPTCPHCHQVIEDLLIPLQDQYGSRLVLMGMEITQEWANGLYWEAIRHYEIPEAEWAVPLLVVGEEVLVGADSIPSRFPGIIEEGLAGEGIDLPSYPALVTFLREADLLDQRYPDRLIALREEPDQGEPPPGDSAGAGDEQAPGDSASTGDSASSVDPDSEADPTPAVDSASGLAPGPAADSGVLVDSVLLSDSTEVVNVGPPSPADSTGGDGPPEDETAAETRELPAEEVAVPDTADTLPGDARPIEGQDTASPSPVIDPAVDSAPGTARTLGSLDLAEAAREMESMTIWDRFNLDRAGNSLSVLVLLVMILSLALRGYPPRVRARAWPSWVIPILVVVGAGVAAYLSFIEVTHTEAVCGPVGDCNTVNQSQYARLFGFLPVGILGLLGYGVILLLWVVRHTTTGGLGRPATLGLWAASFLGTLFSIYLTFLEPFVIGATCAWCLTSAVIMTLLLWATAPLAAGVWLTEEVSPAEG